MDRFDVRGLNLSPVGYVKGSDFYDSMKCHAGRPVGKTLNVRFPANSNAKALKHTIILLRKDINNLGVPCQGARISANDGTA